MVHDVLPVGLPAAFERKLAVTEPWTLKPPLRATWLAGQLTVNCLSPDATPPATVMICEPSRPASPFCPAGPCGPTSPLGPCGPGAPCGPAAPLEPCGPGAPCGPC